MDGNPVVLLTENAVAKIVVLVVKLYDAGLKFSHNQAVTTQKCPSDAAEVTSSSPVDVSNFCSEILWLKMLELPDFDNGRILLPSLL